MSRRMLDSSIWSNENFAALPPRGRLLLIGMITLADDQGRLKAHPLYLAKEFFAYDHTEATDINKWLEMMVENGTIQVYTVEGKQYAQFRNWWQYQSLQFAHASSYPRPEGWVDHLRFNSKGNQMMVANWTTPRGERLVDTCDQEGKLIPFVMELPASKVPAQAATQVPTKVRTLVRTLAPAQVATQAPAQVATEVRTQVTSQLLNLPTTQLETKNNNNSALHALVRAEAEKAVVVVGVNSLIAKFDDKQAMALLSWLWLYNGWHEGNLSWRDIFRRGYESDPFAGMKQTGAVMVSNARARTAAPLCGDDRAEMMDALRRLQEAGA